MTMSSESEGAGDEDPEDNKIDKAFKRLQRKKDKLQHFKRKLKERLNRKKRESGVNSCSNSASPA